MWAVPVETQCNTQRLGSYDLTALYKSVYRLLVLFIFVLFFTEDEATLLAQSLPPGRSDVFLERRCCEQHRELLLATVDVDMYELSASFGFASVSSNRGFATLRTELLFGHLN